MAGYPVKRREMACAVLVVDDHPAYRAYGRCVFEAFDCQVSTASDGLEAVELASRMKFDIIVMDRQMPRCGGDVAAAQIRAMGASRGALILCHSSEGAPPSGLYDHVLEKPATIEDVAAFIPMAGAPKPMVIDLSAYRRTRRA
jgi:CheY-like chemotaxis protein